MSMGDSGVEGWVWVIYDGPMAWTEGTERLEVRVDANMTEH